MGSWKDSLVNEALKWESKFTVMPQVTSAISEYDAALLVGHTDETYAEEMKKQTPVTKGRDFIYNGKCYQIKANRPSGRRGSKVTRVGKARNFEWHFLIWILYDKNFVIKEAWQFDVEKYKELFEHKERLNPEDMRKGVNLLNGRKQPAIY